MTSQELARRTGTYGQATLEDRRSYAQSLAAAAELLPQNYWTKPTMGPNGLIPAQPSPGKVLFMTETAAMLGIHPMAGLTSIHIIEGKPTLSAGLWASLAREAGHRLRVWTEGEGDKLKAVATIVRSDDPDFEFRVEWSHADAQRAGLLNKDNWKKYLRSMLKSRAITEVIREACPEVGMGAAYTAEELSPNLPVNEQGVPIELQHVPDANYTSGGDGTDPAPRPQQRREAPVMEEPEPDPAAPTDEPAFDWGAAVAALTSREEALALHGKARSEGVLDLDVKQGRKKRKLGELIVEVGTAFAEAEKAAAEAPEEVVEATIDEEPPMAMGGE